MSKRTNMPILKSAGSKIPSIRWSVIAGHEAQAQRNHYQSLERLAERGGLGVCEAVAIIEDRPWHRMDKAVAEARLLELCEIDATRSADAVTEAKGASDGD